MKITTKLAAATVAAAGAVSIVGIPTALADDAAATTYEIGQQAKLVNGDNVQGWTSPISKPAPTSSRIR